MSILFVLIPILGALAIFLGSKAKTTALIASGLNLFLGLGSVFCWKAGIWSMSPEILSKPSIHLAFGFHDGMSVMMMLLSVIVLFAATMSGKCPEGREKLWYSSILLIGGGALGAFLSTDLFFFYAFHELALIPTFLISEFWVRVSERKRPGRSRSTSPLAPSFSSLDSSGSSPPADQNPGSSATFSLRPSIPPPRPASPLFSSWDSES